MILLRKALEPFIKGKTEKHDFYELRKKYEHLLVQRATLQKTIQVAEESIERAKLNMV